MHRQQKEHNLFLTAFKLSNMNIHKEHVNEIYYKIIIKKLLTLNYMDIIREKFTRTRATVDHLCCRQRAMSCHRRKSVSQRSGQGSRPVEKCIARARPESIHQKLDGG